MTNILRNLRVDEGSLVDAGANKQALVMLFKRDMHKAETKHEDGEDFPIDAFAHTPESDKPSTWKLRLWDSLAERETAAQVGRAIAAIGAGFRGQKVDIPDEDMPSVKAKIRAAWRKTHPDADADEMPNVLKRDGGDAVQEGAIARWVHAIAKKLGLSQQDVDKMAMTPDEIMAHDKAMQQFWECKWAFQRSVESILSDNMVADKTQMLLQALQEFQRNVEPLMMHIEMDHEMYKRFMSDIKEAGTDIAKVHSVIKALPERSDMIPTSKQRGSEVIVDFKDIMKSIPAEQRAAIESELAKRDGQIADLQKRGEVPEAVTKRLEELEKASAQVADLTKRADAAEQRAGAAEAVAKAEREQRVAREYMEKAKSLPHAGEMQAVADMLRKAYEANEELGKQLEDSLRKQHEAIAQGALFGEVGKGRGETGMDSWEKMEKQAVAKFVGISKEQAIAKFLDTDEGRQAYNQYLNEKEAN